ncbi:MAG: hypothetical protein IT374_08775 [Polyangiaceae bacterium]|nr:hypothetical protein [Polyangiaceae bacterium]
MRLRRLKVARFGVIDEAEVALGPGLNVLYGPNDLGKSTLGHALRVALLLPAKSTVTHAFVPWQGAGDPTVELEFEVGPREIWSVTKRFGPRGTATLSWSKDGRDFDEKAQGRDVDRRLRALLAWGLPEPGPGAPRGMATSFLSTALLSTQAGVAEVLGAGLAEDSTDEGRVRLAASLAAASADPVITEVLERAHARRDEAFTPSGAKRRAQDGPLRRAADLVGERAKEQAECERRVEEARGVEEEVERLTRAVAAARSEVAERRRELDRVDAARAQAAARVEAEAAAREASRSVAEIAARDAELERLAAALAEAEQTTRARVDAAARARAAEAAIERENNPHDADLARAELEAALAAASGARADREAELSLAEGRLAEIAAARARRDQVAALAAEVARARVAVEAEQTRVARAAEELADALRARARAELLSRAREVGLARRDVERLEADARRRADLVDELTRDSERVATITAARRELIVPAADALRALRALERRLATARATLEVGVTIELDPERPLDVEVQLDRGDVTRARIDARWTTSASSEVTLSVGGLGRVHVRGGAAEARAAVAALERRWSEEAAPALEAARARDLDDLEAVASRASALDEERARLEIERSRAESALAALPDVSGALSQAREHLAERAASLGADAAAAERELATLGPGGLSALMSTAAEEEARARELTSGVALATLTERLAQAERRWSDEDAAAREGEATLGGALEEREGEARAQVAAVRAGVSEARARVAATGEALARLASEERARRERQATAQEAARAARAEAEAALAVSERDAATLDAQRAVRAAERARFDLDAAQRLAAETAARAAELPEVAALSDPDRALLASTLERDDGRAREQEIELDRRRGALEQLGGHVARERLAEAVEARGEADRHHRALDVDYEAWKLLYDTLKEVGDEQASHLGTALAPTLGAAFDRLTERRYGGVSLAADLQTEGVVTGGATRDPASLSVGTREQLATLLRLSLAERLAAPLLLDDQLVQSDAPRMAWLRALLLDKCATLQLVVLTCRPLDYLDRDELPGDEAPGRDSREGRVRAVDLARVIRAGRRGP